MQVTEVSAQGLAREFKVVFAADEIEERVRSRLTRLGQTVRVPGFRPGKAPLSLLKKQYGRSIMGEVLEEAVDEGSREAISTNQLRPALRPKIEVTAFDEGKDLEFDLKLEVLPEIPTVDLPALELERQVSEVDDRKVEETLRRLAEARQRFEAPAEPRPSRVGDQVTVSFKGTIDGEAFEGGTAEDLPVVLGSGLMVPGFESQLEGVSEGESRELTVTFPDTYPRAEMRGRTAVFATEVKAVKAPLPVTIDDAFAKDVGLDDLAALTKAMRDRLEEEYRTASRNKLKRQLLDRLAETYPFAVPEGMVELEFQGIWRQLEEEMKRTGQSFAAEGDALGETEEKAKAEYRRIAERRVRLGLLLADIGNKNDIKVEPQELQQAMIREARRFPGQERQVLELFRKNEGALEQLRAPIFEDKVCEFVFQLAKVSERPVTPEALLADPDEEDEAPSAAVPSDSAPAEVA